MWERTFVGEEEVIKMNAELAVRRDFTVEDGKNHLEPDIVVIGNPDIVKDDGCHGAPDLVIEIVSKSTSKRDYGIKMLKYRTADVKEYWIVDPIRETVMVFWFEDETQNELYSLCDEIEFHLFPGLKVKLG